MRFIRKQVSVISGSPVAVCQIVESHYFRGRYRVNEANSKHLLFRERKFEDSLIENDVIFHYKHLRDVQKDWVVTVIEKGVDVWLALEAYELATFRNFDYVVLFTGNADREMLLRKLKAIKTHPILMTWDANSDKATSTARLIREEACTQLDIGKLIIEDKDLLNTICRK